MKITKIAQLTEGIVTKASKSQKKMEELFRDTFGIDKKQKIGIGDSAVSFNMCNDGTVPEGDTDPKIWGAYLFEQETPSGTRNSYCIVIGFIGEEIPFCYTAYFVK